MCWGVVECAVGKWYSYIFSLSTVQYLRAKGAGLRATLGEAAFAKPTRLAAIVESQSSSRPRPGRNEPDGCKNRHHLITDFVRLDFRANGFYQANELVTLCKVILTIVGPN